MEQREPKQLPLFEGLEPNLTEFRLTGSTAGQQEHLRIGQEAWFLMRGQVTAVTHERKPNGLLYRSHKVKIVGAQRVDAKGEVADALVADAYAYLASVDLEDE